MATTGLAVEQPSASTPAPWPAVPFQAADAYRLHADLCRVLTDPKRLMLLDILRTGERSVGDLADVLGVTLPNASQHLAVLRAAGLVEGRRVGASVTYRLTEPEIIAACDVIHRIVERRLATRPAGGGSTVEERQDP